MEAERVRVLFSAAGGHGHLQPLLPLALQAARAGCDVLVTGAASLAGHVTASGLAYAATGPDVQPVHAPLVVQDVERERAVVGSYFVGRLGRARAAAVLDLCQAWRPDVVVRDEVDVGAAVAADVLGLPTAVVNVIGAGGFLVERHVAEPLTALRTAFGLTTDDAMATLRGQLTLTPFPAAFRDQDDPLPDPVVRYQPLPPPPAVQRAAVFVTLGTVFGTESGDLLKRAVRAAAATAYAVVVATGEHVDPASLGLLPDHVRVHRFVDQDQVLAGCRAVVSHAGSGTVLGALRHGLPHVCLPVGADQSLNARRLQALGTGIALRADTADSREIQSAVEHVLGSPAMTRSVAAVRGELAALPGPAHAVEAITRLAATT